MSTRVIVLLGVLAAVAVIAPWLAPYDPERPHRDFLFAPPMPPRVLHGGDIRAPFVYPVYLTDRVAQTYAEDRSRTRPLPWSAGAASGSSPAFLLGSDSYGRDVLSRLLYGARTSIALALLSTMGALVFGGLIGGAAGYRGGWVDEAAMKLADFILLLPLIYVVLVLRAVMPLVLPAPIVFTTMAVIFAVMGWPFVARGVRGIVAREAQREYAVAARSLGATAPRILIRHLLPACGEFIVAQATLLLPAFILAEATLSYVGLGFPEHVPTWGTMLIEATNLSALTRFPWTLAPAVMIFAVVLAVNTLVRFSRAGGVARDLDGKLYIQ